jgi:hypothetical protein
MPHRPEQWELGWQVRMHNLPDPFGTLEVFQPMFAQIPQMHLLLETFPHQLGGDS